MGPILEDATVSCEVGPCLAESDTGTDVPWWLGCAGPAEGVGVSVRSRKGKRVAPLFTTSTVRMVRV